MWPELRNRQALCISTLWVLTEAIPWLLITPGPKGKDIGNFEPYFRPDALLSRILCALCKPVRVYVSYYRVSHIIQCSIIADSAVLNEFGHFDLAEIR